MSAGQWWSTNTGQIYSLILSFVIISTFWMAHHGNYERVGRMTSSLMWLNVAWLLMIVWLPVATAMLGSDMPVDRPQILMYIGPMFVAAVLGLLSCRVIRRRPDLWLPGQEGPGTAQEVLGIALSLLYGLLLAAPSRCHR